MILCGSCGATLVKAGYLVDECGPMYTRQCEYCHRNLPCSHFSAPDAEKLKKNVSTVPYEELLAEVERRKQAQTVIKPQHFATGDGISVYMTILQPGGDVSVTLPKAEARNFARSIMSAADVAETTCTDPTDHFHGHCGCK